MSPAHKQRIRLSGGAELSFTIAGATSDPPILLLHGFPSSARTFREVIPALSKTAWVIAPDLPGFGESDVLPSPSFDSFGEAVSELLEHLSVGPRYIYLHDFGAPVGLDIAMKTPDQVLGLIVQNANAHQTGMGPQWAATRAYWADPSPENEAEATGHLTFEGTRDQYIADVPEDVAARMPTESWEEDWRVMQRPGRMETQRALIADYGNYFPRFEAIGDYLTRWQLSLPIGASISQDLRGRRHRGGRLRFLSSFWGSSRWSRVSHGPAERRKGVIIVRLPLRFPAVAVSGLARSMSALASWLRALPAKRQIARELADKSPRHFH